MAGLTDWCWDRSSGKFHRVTHVMSNDVELIKWMCFHLIFNSRLKCVRAICYFFLQWFCFRLPLLFGFSPRLVLPSFRMPSLYHLASVSECLVFYSNFFAYSFFTHFFVYFACSSSSLRGAAVIWCGGLFVLLNMQTAPKGLFETQKKHI